MATWAWIVIALAIVAVIALVVAIAMRQRRTTILRQRFGPEYDRAVHDRDGRRAAEADLLERQHQREQLDITPLSETERARFAAEWRQLQERFVDQPSHTVVAADDLVRRVMGARGYPMDNFEAQANLISVDHASIVENYRFAHSVCERATSQEISTEDLRAALLHYRSLFDDLLDAEQTSRGDRKVTTSVPHATEDANTEQPTPGGAR
jgi:hypothetical protein